jgi:hypothetical protein
MYDWEEAVLFAGASILKASSPKAVAATVIAVAEFGAGSIRS